MIPDLLLTVAERLANTALRLDPQVADKLAKVRQQSLLVDIRDWQQGILIIFDGEQLMLFSATEEKHADCVVSADLATLKSLKDPSHITRLIREGKLDLDGDLQLAQTYSGAFAGLDIDWAEQMSKVLGDAPAQVLYDKLREFKTKGDEATSRGQKALTSLLQDELAVAIHPLEMADFKQQTRKLSADLAALEQRINRLLK